MTHLRSAASLPSHESNRGIVELSAQPERLVFAVPSPHRSGLLRHGRDVGTRVRVSEAPAFRHQFQNCLHRIRLAIETTEHLLNWPHVAVVGRFRRRRSKINAAKDGMRTEEN